MDTRRLWRMWWSGVCSVVAVGHLVRTFGQVPVTIGTARIPIWVSWVIVPLAGAAAGWLMRTALEATEPPAPLPPWERLGGCHPKTVAHEERVGVASLSCGVYVSTYPFVDEEDEDAAEHERGKEQYTSVS